MSIRVKRVYEHPEPGDGVRILVDGLWPRGLSKQYARLHLWLRDLAPSAALRRWFGQDRSRWRRFKARYARELRPQRHILSDLARHARRVRLTLLYGAKDERFNHAVALKEFLENPDRCAEGS